MDLLSRTNMVSRTKALQNLRDRQFGVYKEADQSWVEPAVSRAYTAPKVSAAELATAPDDQLESALARSELEQGAWWPSLPHEQFRCGVASLPRGQLRCARQ